MKTSVMMYGEPEEVANELCSCDEPEEVLHVDLIAALGNALNRIAKLEKALGQTTAAARQAANAAVRREMPAAEGDAKHE
jgi:predicted ATPase